MSYLNVHRYAKEDDQDEPSVLCFWTETTMRDPDDVNARHPEVEITRYFIERSCSLMQLENADHESEVEVTRATFEAYLALMTGLFISRKQVETYLPSLTPAEAKEEHDCTIKELQE